MKMVIRDTQALLAARKLGKMQEAQRFVDSEVLRRCEPRVPHDTGELNRSGERETQIGSGEVRYRTPYARRWYYEPAHFQGAPMRGNYWFTKMLNRGGREAILRGAARIVGAKVEGLRGR